MKSFIKKRIREQISLDEKNLNYSNVCKKMTINSFEEAFNNVEEALKNVDRMTRYKIMRKIYTPLHNLKHEKDLIANEVKEKGMSGDSIPDEADTYWHQIQSIFCKGIY